MHIIIPIHTHLASSYLTIVFFFNSELPLRVDAGKVNQDAGLLSCELKGASGEPLGKTELD